MILDLSAMKPAQVYFQMIQTLIPRPIAWVTTRFPDGGVNAAPFSFFNAVGSDPMTLLFCPGNRADGADKDTLRNALPAAEGGTTAAPAASAGAQSSAPAATRPSRPSSPPCSRPARASIRFPRTPC